MLGRLPDMGEEEGLGGELDLAHATPIFKWIVGGLRPIARI